MLRGLLLFLALLMTSPLLAAPHIRAELVAESSRPAAGQSVTLAFAMTPEPGWHGYWKNPGDSGIETSVTWTLPTGVSAGPLQYQVPTTLLVSGLMNYVYERPYAHLVTLTVPAGLAAGTPLPIRAKLDWLECTKEICVPASAELALELVVGDGKAGRRADFDRWRAAMPRPLGSPAAFSAANGAFRLAVPLPEGVTVQEPYFFPLTDGAIDYAQPQAVSRSGDTLIVETKAGGAPTSVEGVLRIGEGVGLTLTAAPGRVPAAGTPLAQPAGLGDRGAVLLALGGALLGGLLLNIMPCVFPILSLKALSLAKAGGNERAARADALAYSAGILLVCLGLGAVLLALRAGGLAAGWGFQLQDARVVLALMLLTSVIALNLAGLFEFGAVNAGGALAGKSGPAGAFWTGALAAFVAMPCTGPFMAGALGAAMVLPTAAALAVFGGLGLGLALPFLAIGFSRRLRGLLPKPGAWMERFRRVLAVPMFATALWLAWVLGHQAGVDAMTAGIAAALVLALALWWVGTRQARGKRAVWVPLLPALLLASGAALLVPRSGDGAAAATAKGLPGVEPFSEQRLAALRAEGRPVFAYFTADWCLNCKVNERTAINRAETAQAFGRGNVAVLVGDWTRGDPAIGRFIESHGRSGVPLYLYYAPGRPPEVLPQVLTVGRLTGLVG